MAGNSSELLTRVYVSPERKVAIEEKQTALLTRLQNLGIPDYEKGNSLFYSDAAIADLSHVPIQDDVTASLKVAKAFVQDSLGFIRNESYIMLAVIQATINTNPKLFGELTEDLQAYVLSVNDVLNFPNPSAKDSFSNETTRLKLTQRFQAGASVMIQMSARPGAGIGDVLLTIPSIKDLAISAPANRIYFAVRDDLLELVQSVLPQEDYPNITILRGTTYTDNVTAIDELLAPVPETNRPAGILFSYKPSQHMLYAFEQESRLTPILFRDLQNPRVLPTYEDHAIHQPYAVSRDAEFSFLFGLTVSDPNTKEHMARMRQQLNEYIDDYVDNNSTVQKDIEAARKFPNGYICIVDKGSSRAKWITPGLTRELAKFAKEKAMGVVFLHVSQETDGFTTAEETAPFEEFNVAYHHMQIAPNTDLRHSLALIRDASITFAPDTGLLHAAELLHTKRPVINIAINSDVTLFGMQQDNFRMIEHPLAEAVRMLGDKYRSINRLVWFLDPFHPLDPNLQLDLLHPMIRSMQQAYKERVTQVLAALQTQTIR